jgi:multiple sugar transport system permease protein
MQITRSYLSTFKVKNFNTILKRWMFRTGIDPFTYAVRLAVILILMVFFVTPMLWLFTAPTKTNDQMLELPALAIGSLNYIPTAWMHLMSYLNGIVLRWIMNSVNYVVLGLILSLITSIPAGFTLAVIRFPGRKILLWITLLVMLVPGDALVLPMYLELFYLRLIDTPWALIVPAASFPMGTYLTFQYFKSILPPDIIAAARVDGCSDFQLFTKIGLPLSKNIIGVLAFTNFAALWGNFFAANLLIDTVQYKTLPSGIGIILANCGAVLPAAMRCSIPPDGGMIARAEIALLGAISTLPVLIIYLLAQRLVIRGTTAGAIKG